MAGTDSHLVFTRRLINIECRYVTAIGAEVLLHSGGLGGVGCVSGGRRGGIEQSNSIREKREAGWPGAGQTWTGMWPLHLMNGVKKAAIPTSEGQPVTHDRA